MRARIIVLFRMNFHSNSVDIIVNEEWIQLNTSLQYFFFVHEKDMTIENKLRALFTLKNI